MTCDVTGVLIGLLRASANSEKGGRACDMKDGVRFGRANDNSVYQRLWSPGARGISAAKGRQRFIGRTDQRRRFIQHHRYRDIAQHLRKMPLVAKRLKESAVLNLRQNFHRNSARNVNTAECEYLQRQIPGFRTINLRPKI